LDRRYRSGRDDRVLSDHGREARFPFLDDDFVRLVNRLPLEYKAKLWLPRGVYAGQACACAQVLARKLHFACSPGKWACATPPPQPNVLSSSAHALLTAQARKAVTLRSLVIHDLFIPRYKIVQIHGASEVTHVFYFEVYKYGFLHKFLRNNKEPIRIWFAKF
jgi:hypothetical protein